MPELLLINPNTTRSMTEKMATAAHAVLPSDVLLHSATSEYGPESIEGYYDEVFAVPPMLEIIRRMGSKVDGIVVGCFDDTGVEAARCVSDAPVIGICEAACQHASLLAPKFSIITTLSRSVQPLEHKVFQYGFERQCQSVRASDIPVLDLELMEPESMKLIFDQIEAALVQDGSEAIVLGCAGMVDLQKTLQDKYQVPVIEGVTAAVQIMQGIARLPTRTSRVRSYAKPGTKTYQGLFERYSPCDD